MGLFDRLYYGKAGKRDYSEMDMPKNRVSLFFLVLKDHFFDLVKVNLLQLVFWIPFLLWLVINLMAIQAIDTEAVLASSDSAAAMTNAVSGYLVVWLLGLIPCVAITGPSSAGAAYVMRNWARDQHSFMFSDFKDAFKSNWKQSLIISLLTSVVPVLGYAAVTYYSALASANVAMLLPLVIVLSAVLMWALMLVLLYPLIIGYELKFKYLLKNAFLMAAASLPQVALARIITIIPVVLFVVGLYTANTIMLLIVAVYYMFFGFALSKLIYASFANGIFDKFLHPLIEGAQVRQGLRPETEEDMLFDDDDEEDEEDEI